MNTIRSPIVSVLGHVDHGKSSVLDAIRNTNILATEAGAITQAIGASIVPAKTIIQKCGNLLTQLGVKLTIPGLLFIDTPGHAAFTSLRKRGSALADIAIVVVDINEGFKPQTYETIEILRAAKTPFIIAANKLDIIPRFRAQFSTEQKNTYQPILNLITKQDPQVIQTIETKMYEIVGQLYEKFQVTAERFDRINDFTQQVAIVPISAKEQLGLAELLMVLSALAQKYLEKNLTLNEKGPAKGTILEVKKEKGLGKTMDVIIYNGTLRINDTVIIGGLNGPIITRVRALFEPEAHSEMRDKKSLFKAVKEVTAATGVKISCPEMEGILSGMPIFGTEKTDEAIAQTKQLVQDEIDTVRVKTDDEGIIIKADNIGSLEALSTLLREKDFKIRKASVGQISKKDITDAESNLEQNPLTATILGFNIPEIPSTDKVKIITSPIIYHLIEKYGEWVKTEERRIAKEKLKDLPKPFKAKVLPNCIFRQSNPCVAGVEIIEGIMKTNMQIIKKGGEKLSYIKEIQLNKENVKNAKKGEQVAISIPHITGGRQLNEEDVLYSDISPPDFRALKENSKLLTTDEIDLLKEIAEIKRKNDPLWGK